ncbi:MAG TPA: hypothetical protein VE135_21330 [Pyrinomonadaceae bacterium]|nr:hypothetical protein [Pyrinomonadaceae bacterium]
MVTQQQTSSEMNCKEIQTESLNSTSFRLKVRVRETSEDRTMNYRTAHLPSLIRLRVFGGSLCVCLALLSGCQGVKLTSSNQSSPEDALERFYTSKGPEDTLMDPLIIAGDKVVPIVLKEVKNKKMPRRRYAIRFLGNGSYSDAMPVLRSILQDSGEEDYFRGDALISINLIDESLGREFAQKSINERNNLGDVSHQVLSGYPEIRKRRSYLDAIAGHHE